jgi:hypothetical protein
MFDFVRALEWLILFGSLGTLHNLSGAISSLCRSLCLHIDRGLERHGYPWIPTD